LAIPARCRSRIGPLTSGCPARRFDTAGQALERAQVIAATNACLKSDYPDMAGRPVNLEVVGIITEVVAIETVPA
jgi:nucleoside diphosphate kinase